MKIKGEDYRSSGIGGWMWRSSTFRNKTPSKPPIKVIKTEVDDVTESAYSDVVDVTASLLDRRNGCYGKSWPSSKVDRILKIRWGLFWRWWRFKFEFFREAQKENGKKNEEKMEVLESKKMEEAREAAAKSLGKSTKVEQYQHARQISRRFRRGRKDRIKISGERSDSCHIWKLKVPKEGSKVKPVQMPLPWLFAATKRRKKNIFR